MSRKIPYGVRRLLTLARSRTRLLRDSDEHRAYAERRVAHRTRSRGIVEWIEAWGQDLRFANRQFARNRGFTALAVLTLALGIGANTAIFSVVHRLLIAPLPYPDGNRLVKLVVASGDDFRFDLRSPNGAIRLAWRDRARSLEMVAAVSVDALYLQDFGEPRDTIPAYVTSNYLRLLGVQPALGRGFTEEEERSGAAPVAMISYGKWQREYGGRSHALGSTIRVADRQYTIVGVTPPAMSIPMSTGIGATGNLQQPEPAIWLPSSLDSIGGDHLFAKLRAGVPAPAASRELQAILEDLPGVRGSQLRARAMRAQDFLDPRETQTVEVLFVAVGVLLLIACANVANLLLSRGWTRRREFAVRVALGAGRVRLARQVLTESVLLALAGGVLGIGVAWQTLRMIIALRPPTLRHLDAVRVETEVLLWSAGISVATGILFGCAPALFAGARPVGDVLRGEARSASGGTVARRVRSTLIVLEIAMALVLLVGAGLLVRSFVALQRMPLHFEPRGIVSANLLSMFPRNWSDEVRAARRDELVERLRAIPGVTEATIGMMPGQGWRAVVPLETEPDASGQSRSISEFSTYFVTPGYFRLLGMSLVQGRVPDSLAGTRPVRDGQRAMSQEVVVNRALARRLWPDGRAVGARLRTKPSGPFPAETYTVVGVAEDVRIPGRRSVIAPVELYQPIPGRMGAAAVILRTTLPEKDVVASIRRVIAEHDAALRATSGMSIGAVLQSVTVGDTYLRESLAPARFAMALLAAFAVIALLLSAVGLYGVIAYSVTQRTREIGVRVALGADARAVRRLVVGGGLQLAAVGVFLGVVVAAASTRVLASLLYGVSPADPVSFAAIAVLVVTIALAASYVPARRATRIDPTEALRAD